MKNALRVFIPILFFVFAFGASAPSAFASTLNVNNFDSSCKDDGSGTSYCTIQAAIVTSTSGDTINVATGTYTEQLTIDKNLTLIGAGDTTVIQSPDTLTSKFDRTSDKHMKPVITVTGATADISHLKVDGAAKGDSVTNTYFVGIGLYNAGGSLDNVTVTGIKETSSNYDNQGEAIVAINADSSSRTLSITNSTVSDFQKNGLSLSGANLTVTVSGNTITGLGANDKVAQNGIQITGGATGTIENNTIGGFRCDYVQLDPSVPGDLSCTHDWYNNYQANAISLAGAIGPITVSGNTISNSDVGIYSQLNSGVATITNNILTNNRWFGMLFYKGDVAVSGGSVTGGEIGIFTPSDHQGGSTAVHNVSISGNSTAGLKNEAASLIIDATNNWWGNASDPGTGDKVSTNVSFSPWYIDAGKAILSNSITLTINSGENGTAGTSGTHTYGDVVTLTDSPAANYHLVNWTGDADCTDGSVSMTANITCTANFAIDTHIVTFDKNGGTVDASPTTQITDYNTTVTLPTASTRTGYTFDSWNTATDGSGTTFDVSTPVVADVTVYAKWKANQTISFDDLAGRTYGDSTFDVSATATSGFAVSFDSQSSSVCTVNGTTVTIVSAGTCTIRASQAGDSNNNVAPSADRSFAVAKATPTATLAVNNSPVIYNGTLQSAMIATTTASVAGSVGNVKYSGSSTVPTTVGTYVVTADFVPTDTANYSTRTGLSAGNFVINKATAVVSVTPYSETYDGTAHSAIVTSITGVNGETGATVGTVSLNTTHVGAGTYASDSWSFTGAGNYNNIAATTITDTINKATPTATLAVNNSPVTYTGSGQTATVSIDVSSVPGAVANILTGGSATKTNAATYVVTADFIPTDTTNYNTLTVLSAGNFVINKATPTIIWTNPADITYGTALSAMQLNATSNGDGTPTYSPVAGTLLNAGDSQGLTVTFGATDNYNATTQTVYINVAKATPSITWADPADITYGTALGGTQLNASPSVAGSLVYTLVAGTVLSVGSSQTLSVAFTPTDTANYNAASQTAHINVAKANASITIAGYTGTYDGNAHGASITTATGVGGAELSSSVSLGSSFTNVPGGTASWSFTNANYNSQSGDATIIINIDPSSSSSVLETTTTETNTIGVIPTASTLATTTPVGNVEVAIPANLTITGPIGWNGTVNLPTATTTDVNPTPDSGMNATVTGSIEIGFGNTVLTFDKGVRVIFVGQKGKQIGYSHGAGTFTQITNVCTDDSQATGDALTAGSDCKINVGSDLVIWTKHFSTFTTYTQTAIPAPVIYGGSGGGGGGGGGSVLSSLPTATPAVPGVIPAVPATPAPSRGQVLGASMYNFTKFLAIGSRDAEVTALQQFLIDNGFSIPAGVTGYYGAQTKVAVMAFQKAHGITQAGYVGPSTREELNKGTVSVTPETSTAVGKTNLTTAQANAILSLIESFGAEASVVENVKASLGL